MKDIIFALSDIHGRDVSIEDFVEHGFDIKNPAHKIVCVGDFFDRGTNNLGVLEFVEAAKAQLGDRFITIYGNHDQMMMQFLEDLKTYELGMDLSPIKETSERWFRNGGPETLDELFGDITLPYDTQMQANAKRMQRFVDDLVPYYENEGYIFVHAAINEQREVDTWSRTFIHEGIDTEKTIVIGHTTHAHLDENTKRIHLDVGVVATSTLSPQCVVYDIDNGKGNNITRFE